MKESVLNAQKRDHQKLFRFFLVITHMVKLRHYEFVLTCSFYTSFVAIYLTLYSKKNQIHISNRLYFSRIVTDLFNINVNIIFKRMI